MVHWLLLFATTDAPIDQIKALFNKIIHSNNLFVISYPPKMGNFRRDIFVLDQVPTEIRSPKFFLHYVVIWRDRIIVWRIWAPNSFISIIDKCKKHNLLYVAQNDSWPPRLWKIQACKASIFIFSYSNLYNQII